MSLYAVEAYVASILDGLVAANLPAAQAWVQPPPVTQPAEAPQIYVWGSNLNEERATYPRGAGQRRTLNNVDIILQWIADQDSSTAPFPVLIDAVRSALRAVVLPVDLTDPYSGEQSSLTDFAERIKVDHPTPRTVGEPGSGTYQHVAKVTVSCNEWVGGV